MSNYSKSTKWLYVAGFVGVVGVVILKQPLLENNEAKSIVAPTELKLSPPPALEKLPPTPAELAKPHLDRAQRESERIIGEHIGELDIFFANSKRNTIPFAKTALSWGTKWRLIVDYTPFFEGDRHKMFIRDNFEKYIFNSMQLEVAVKQVVNGYLAHIRSLEGKMIVDLRADMADFPATYTLAELSEENLLKAYNDLLKSTVLVTGNTLHTDISTDLVSIIVGEALTVVAARLGVSAGVLGAGAGSGWATLGIGVVVGLIVDQFVSWIWDWWADPLGNLTHDVNAKLDGINRLLGQELSARLKEFAKERENSRGQAVLGLFQPGVVQ